MTIRWLLAAAFGWLAGCSQESMTPAQTEQDSAQQGAVTVYVWNTGEPDSGGLLWSEAVSTSGLRTVSSGAIDGEDMHAGNIVVAHITVTTGGQTGELSGTTTATSDTTQDVKPEVTASLPVAFAPGGIADSTGTVAGRGTATTTVDKQTEARITSLEAQNATLMDALSQLINAEVPTIVEPVDVP